MKAPATYPLALMAACALLLARPANALEPAYSTDMAEPSVATVKNDRCCDVQALKENANVRLRVEHALYALMPLEVEVVDADNQQVTRFTTRDQIIYMRLPEGRYTIKISAFVKKKIIEVDATDAVLKSYAI